MEKTTDSTTSPNSGSTISSGGSSTTGSSNASAATAISSEANQQEQILQKHHLHNHPDNSKATTYTATPNKNQHNNSLGCGPSSTTTAASSSLDRGVCSSMVVGGSKNLNSNNNISSLNNNTLGNQSLNKTTTSTSFSTNDSTLSNTTSSLGSPASTSITTTSLTSSLQMAPINLNISTTTGGNFSVSVDPQITVENLKKIIAKKLKVAKDRICLLHREKELQDGLLKDNNLMDGSKIILIPNVETGLLAQRPENTVMQALESLNDSQVNDFLSGKTPLNLSMRLGDHMMLIQLQLSTVNPVNGVAHNGANCSSSSSRQRSSHHHHHHHRSSRSASTASSSTQTAAGTAMTANHSHHHHHHHHHHHSSITEAAARSATTSASLTPTAVSVASTAQNVAAVRKLELDTTSQTPHSNISTSTLIAPHAIRTAANMDGSTSSSTSTSAETKTSDLSSFLIKRDYESLQNIVKSIAMAQPSRLVKQSIISSNATSSTMQASGKTLSTDSSTSVPALSVPSFHTASEAVLLEQSPIKSLSNLVSSPIKTTAIKNIPKISNNTNSSSSNNSVALGPHSASISAVSSASSNASVAGTNSIICHDPIAAKLTSCLCTRLNGGSLGAVNNTQHASAKHCIETACISQQQLQTPSLHHHNHHQRQLNSHATRTSTSAIMTSTSNYKATLTPGTIITALNGAKNSLSSSPSRTASSLHKTAHNPISRKHRHHHHHHHHHHYHHAGGIQQQLNTTNNQKVISHTSTPIKVLANDSGFNSCDDSSLNATSIKSSSSSISSSPAGNTSQSPNSNLNTTPVVAAAAAAPLATSNSIMTASNTNSTTSLSPNELDDSGMVSDSRTLAEASRNLTQTLRKLSKEVFTNKIDFSASEETPRKSSSGAVIESMKNHGKGIYSGTFSGTLNPALQDRYGRPKRDISTVIHILNDLLSATPQYHRGARISFEAPSTSAAAAASVAAASSSTSAVHHSSRSKHLSSKHHQSFHPCVKCIKTHNSSSSTINLQSASTANASGATNTNIAVASSPVCAYGECNGHYVTSKLQSTKSYTCCQQDSTIAATSSSSVSTAAAALVQQHQVSLNGISSSTGSHTSNGHHHHQYHGSSHHHHHHHHQMVDERKVCQCRYSVHSETGERERDHTCQKCAAELDNIKTKSKLDQLRLVMQQRKQKREARKLKGAPYGARVVSTTTTAAASGVTDNTASCLTTSNSTISTPISVATSATTPSEVSPNHLVEEVDTAA